MSLDTEYFSMYSLISILTILFSSSKRLAASVFASSVLPTPVGPRNRNEPIGLPGSLIPALDLIIASVTFLTASSCPTTLLWSSFPRLRVLLRSLSLSLVTGIPVHFDTILPISSSVTHSCTRVSSLSLTIFSSSASCFCKAGSLPYWSSAAFSRLYSLCAC